MMKIFQLPIFSTVDFQGARKATGKTYYSRRSIKIFTMEELEKTENISENNWPLPPEYDPQPRSVNQPAVTFDRLMALSTQLELREQEERCVSV